jgi:hypothetical protein
MILATNAKDTRPDAPRAGPRILRVRGEDHFAAAGDDAAVRRGREAWLRSLDRKYGIAH